MILSRNETAISKTITCVRVKKAFCNTSGLCITRFGIVFPLVDNQQLVEAIINLGSQIITMSKDVCMDLMLIYDPSIVLNMQSTNGEIDKSLRLACNVPMRIGDITLYVQIHIIRSPAYDILLSRPFDILTENVVRNFVNEDQTITIFNPSSSSHATIPTSTRGHPRCLIQRVSFLTSMI